MQDGRPQFACALSNQPDHKFRIAPDDPVSPGNVVRFSFNYEGGGIGKAAIGSLFVDGNKVAEGRVPTTIAVRVSLDETFDVAEDTGTPVVENYADKMPHRTTGQGRRWSTSLVRPISEDRPGWHRRHD
jgi:arylsulfatase